MIATLPLPGTPGSNQLSVAILFWLVVVALVVLITSTAHGNLED